MSVTKSTDRHLARHVSRRGEARSAESVAIARRRSSSKLNNPSCTRMNMFRLPSKTQDPCLSRRTSYGPTRLNSLWRRVDECGANRSGGRCPVSRRHTGKIGVVDGPRWDASRRRQQNPGSAENAVSRLPRALKAFQEQAYAQDWRDHVIRHSTNNVVRTFVQWLVNLLPRIHGTAWRPPRRLTSFALVKWAWPHERLVSAHAHPRGHRDGHASVRHHIPFSKPHHILAGQTGALVAIGGTSASASIVLR